MILKLLYLAIILVFIIDYSGVIGSIEDFVSRGLFHSKTRFHIPKPFSCSMCMEWWSGLIYLLVIHEFTLFNVMLVALMAASTIVIGEIMAFGRDLLLMIISKLREFLRV